MKEQKFSFKQFSVSQDCCAMKVGTDGVLLGAWLSVSPDMTKALDIGSGTGLIALMLAQRFPLLQINGVEIDDKAVEQSRENVLASPWSSRINIIAGDIRAFKNEKFDVIVSNPPFFTDMCDSLNKQRMLARHENTLSFVELFAKVKQLLNKNGQFSLIYPSDRVLEVEALARDNTLFCQRKTIVFPNPQKKSKRILQTFSSIPCENYVEDKLTIETGIRHDYTDSYKKILADFYLAF